MLSFMLQHYLSFCPACRGMERCMSRYPFLCLDYFLCWFIACRGILNTANFFKFACHGMLYCMLRHACYCQFMIFAHAMACCPLCLGMRLTFSSLHCFESFSSPFDYNARIIICKIKYHIKVSKMIITLTKLLSKATLKYIKFYSYQPHIYKHMCVRIYTIF